jgi:hypothetical protein
MNVNVFKVVAGGIMFDMIKPPRLTQERSRVGVVNTATVWPSWRTDFEEVFLPWKKFTNGKPVQNIKILQ